MKALALITTLIAGTLLLYGTRDFPAWGDPDSPASRYLSTHYLEQAVKETHVPNIVTAVLGDYRGYDTMFETVVIYCAGVAVASILWRRRENP